MIFYKNLLKKLRLQFKIIPLQKNLYNNYWSKVNRVAKIQDKLLKENYSPDIKRIIIFLTGGYNIINGGILSIVSLFKETQNLKRIHNAEVIMCTNPGDMRLLRYTRFKNDVDIYDFSDIFSYLRRLEEILIHIGEYAVEQFLNKINSPEFRYELSYLRKLKKLHLNILNQNINMMPLPKYITLLKEFGTVTCTTAHDAYSNAQYEEYYGCPIHKFSTFISPEQYIRISFSKKENLFVISPDTNENKSDILFLIKKNFPDLKLKIIENLTYEKYRRLISKAKWCLTLGEGLDNYFIETIFSGGISFAIYNDKFFTNEFKTLKTVYSTSEILFENIISDLKELDNEINYNKYQKIQYNLCSKYYNFNNYVNNIKSFYEKYFKKENLIGVSSIF